MKKIEKLGLHQMDDAKYVGLKINEVIDRVNSITERLFPGWTPKENKGYENEELTNHKISDPNDR